MKTYRAIPFLIGFFFLTGALHAQNTSLITPVEIQANEQHETIRFGVMLPPSYTLTDRTYPVVYYMHGANRYYLSSRAEQIASIFTEKFTTARLPEFIMVFIDGGEGYWMDHFDGALLLETDIVETLIPYMDRTYRTDPDRRLTMGYSMGGNGAVFFYTKHPELFAATASLDGGIVTYEDYIARTGGRPEIIPDVAYFLENGSPYGWVERNRDALQAKQDTSIFLSAALLKEAHHEFLSLLEAQQIPAMYVELADYNHEFGYVFSESEEALTRFLLKTLK